MAKTADNGLSTFIAISVFILIVAVWVFIPPGVIRSAWIAERAEVYAMAGRGESAVTGNHMAFFPLRAQ